MDMEYYKKFEPIDGKWYITRELGSGAFGKVFEVERRDFGIAKSAMKIVSIPDSQSEVNNFREENYDLDENSISSYYYGIVEEFVKEFQVMADLRGHSNIVSYEDHDVRKKEDGIGWDIFIRMELLTSLNKHFINNTPHEKDIAKLGIDICKALEACQKYKIIHRDIKPGNIFVSELGDYKLGDFGVARTLEKTTSGLSKKGTYTYMAPEIYNGGEYGCNVDIYSLGIVMYKLLNNNMEPFRKEKTFSDGEAALERRLKGEQIPRPANGSEKLAEIVLKACEFNPKSRYQNPSDMRKDLENIYLDISHSDNIDTGVLQDATNSVENHAMKQDEEVSYSEEITGTEDNKTVSMFESENDNDGNDENEKTVSMFGNPDYAAENEKTVSMLKKEDYRQETESSVPILNSAKNNAEISVSHVRHEPADSSQAKKIIGLFRNNKKLSVACAVIVSVIIILSAITAFTVSVANKAKPENTGLQTDSETMAKDFDNAAQLISSIQNDGTVDASVIAGEIGAVQLIIDEYNSMDKSDNSINAISVEWEKLNIAVNKLNEAYEILKNTPATDTADNNVQVICEICGSTEHSTDLHPSETVSCEICGSTSHTTNDHPKQEKVACSICGSTSHTTGNHPKKEKVVCSICGSASHTTKNHPKQEKVACSICGSTSHTAEGHPRCPVCGSTAHTVHPQEVQRCPVCGSTEHTVHPQESTKCPVCGSIYHTVHPSSNDIPDL